eukprot:6294117-Amphidinium_carterae.3
MLLLSQRRTEQRDYAVRQIEPSNAFDVRNRLRWEVAREEQEVAYLRDEVQQQAVAQRQRDYLLQDFVRQGQQFKSDLLERARMFQQHALVQQELKERLFAARRAEQSAPILILRVAAAE